MRYLSVLALLTVGCGQSEGVLHYIPPVPDAPAPPTVPTPPNAPGSPTCKAFSSVWYTLTTPENQLMGQNKGVSAPAYAIDLTALAGGDSYGSFAYDPSHSCTYAMNLDSSRYIIKNFIGCNPGVIPPGGTVNDQCNYCPSVAPSSTALNIEYDINLTCNSLTITDKNTAKSVTYY